jgi:hypothetical protein
MKKTTTNTINLPFEYRKRSKLIQADEFFSYQKPKPT